MKALVIDEPWISLILQGSKTWEMRKTACSHRGPIALIRKGSGQVVGVAKVVDSLAELGTLQSYAAAEPFHCIAADRQERAFADGWRTPWVLTDARTLDPPVMYQHPSGAVIWVNLGADVAEQIEGQLEGVQGALTNRGATPDRLVSLTNGCAPQSRPPARLSPRQKVNGRIEGDDRAVIPLTEGNIRNGHFYLRSVLNFFPDDTIGGSDRTQVASVLLEVRYLPESAAHSRTDIAGPNQLSREKRSAHYFFRERGAVREFFARAGAAPGDEVVIERTGPYAFAVTLQKLE